jgi:hypothetical protein
MVHHHRVTAARDIDHHLLQHHDAAALVGDQRRRLVELYRDWAVIDLPVNRSQRIFYRRNVDPAKITLPWVKQASLR